MVKEAHRILEEIDRQVYIKVPVSYEGIKAIKMEGTMISLYAFSTCAPIYAISAGSSSGRYGICLLYTSSPPAPPLISTMTFLLSFGSLGINKIRSFSSSAAASSVFSRCSSSVSYTHLRRPLRGFLPVKCRGIPGFLSAYTLPLQEYFSQNGRACAQASIR